MTRTSVACLVLGSMLAWQGCFSTETVPTGGRRSSGGTGSQPTGGSGASDAGAGGESGSSETGGTAGAAGSSSGGTHPGGGGGSGGKAGNGGKAGSGDGARCGDGTLDGTETCDDENLLDGDGCSETCAREAGWLCDDEEPTTCEEVCGDGLVVGREALAGGCDDRNSANDDGCSPTCRVEPGWSCSMAPSRCQEGCGDGLVTLGEACDDHNSDQDDGCFSCAEEPGWSCTGQPSSCATTCGDGVTAGDEECDDDTSTEECAYGQASCEVCDETCHFIAGQTHVCGDGVVDSPDEECDDEDATAGDGCSDVCAVEQGYTCTGAPSTCMRPPLGPGLSVGEEFSCGISRDGALKCWGYNASGQLGLENTMNRGDDPNELLNQPPVNLGTDRTTRAISAGYENTCALLDDYSVKCWGRYGGGGALGTMGDALPVVDLGTNRTAKAVSRGRDFACAILDDDSVKCWGEATWGQLGLGDTTRRVAPADMGDNLPALDFGGSSAAVAISAGALHACAIRSDGVLFCWGSGNQGSTGLGSGEASLRPAAVDLGTQRRAKAVVAGLDGTCAILDNDSVKCWGYGAFGRLGIGELGSRGDAPQEMGDYLPAVNLGTGRTAKDVALGIEHACALLDDDSVKCWGRNEGTGCLGLGDEMNRYLPEHMGDALPRVNLGTGRTAKAIGAGYGFTCALLDEDTIKCWGRSDKGQLGLGTKTARGTSANQMGDALPALNFGW